MGAVLPALHAESQADDYPHRRFGVRFFARRGGSAGVLQLVDRVLRTGFWRTVVVGRNAAFNQLSGLDGLHYRADYDVPLVIPEVNGEQLADYRQRNIVAVQPVSLLS